MSSLSSAFAKATKSSVPVVIGSATVTKDAITVTKPSSSASVNSDSNENDTHRSKKRQRDSNENDENTKNRTVSSFSSSSSRSKKNAYKGSKNDDPEKLERTLFIGNINVNVTKEQLANLIRNHLKQPSSSTSASSASSSAAASSSASSSSAASSAKSGPYGPDIESIRFRSIPIEAIAVTPGSNYKTMIKAAVLTGHIKQTNTLTITTAKHQKQLKKLKNPPSKKSRKTDDDDDNDDDDDESDNEEEDITNETTTLSSSSSSLSTATCNAYVVFYNPQHVTDCLSLHNTLFYGTHIRTDRVIHTNTNGTTNKKSTNFDYKRTVFIGNLPFTITEEELRNFFTESLPSTIIDNIRIIRDKLTHQGKGIAFVLLTDRLGVVDALNLHGKQYSGRTLRVQRCTADGRPIQTNDNEKMDHTQPRNHGLKNKHLMMKTTDVIPNKGGKNNTSSSSGNTTNDRTTTTTTKVRVPDYMGHRGYSKQKAPSMKNNSKNKGNHTKNKHSSKGKNKSDFSKNTQDKKNGSSTKTD